MTAKVTVDLVREELQLIRILCEESLEEDSTNWDKAATDRIRTLLSDTRKVLKKTKEE